MLQTHGFDKYKRTSGGVILSDRTNVNHTLAKEDWCWLYRKSASLNTELEQLEKAAREAKKDLWVEPHLVLPWEWRKGK